MKKKIGIILVTGLLVIGSLTGLFDLGTMKAKGTPISGLISTDTTWDLAGSPWIVIGDVVVDNGATLTVDPGVDVKFDGYYSIYVDGNLTAVGTETEMIDITSNLTIPNKGDWNRIQVNSTAHIDIEYCNIKYGNYGINLYYSSHNNITSNNVSNNNYGIYLYSGSNNTIVNNSVFQQKWDGIYLYLGSNYNIITNNTIYSNGRFGIYLWSNSNYNAIENNTITSNGNNGISLSSSSNNTIKNNTVSSNSDDGVYLASSSYNFIMNNNISSNKWGIYLFPSSRNNQIADNKAISNDVGIYLAQSSNNNITNNNASNNDYGITLDSAIKNNVTNNVVSMNTMDGIRISMSSQNDVVNNTVLKNMPYGIRIYFSSNNNFKYNNVTGNSYSIYLESSSYNNITKNKVTNNGHGFYLTSSSNNTIINNNASQNSWEGLYLVVSSNNIVINNDFFLISNHGIDLFKASNNTITNNNVSLNDKGGINLDSSLYNNIANNYVSSNNENGFRLQSSSYNNITDNYVSSNNENGIRLQSSSHNNISNNNFLFSPSNYVGIYLVSSIYNNITGNNVSNNDYGIILSSSSNNRIYHNNIIDNNIQSEDNSNTNNWNYTYPSGGNYWSSFDEVAEGCADNFDGATTPQTGGGGPDGICDVQYNIDVDSIDFYPFTRPFGPPAPPTNLSAELTGNSLENVTIAWDASLDDPLKVTNYAVYYNTTYDVVWSNYDFLTEIPGTGASKYYLTVQSIGEGNPNDYFFYVQANDTEGYSSKNNTQVAKFTRNLTAGKNLVSVPLILNNTNAPIVLQTLKFNAAWYYNNTDFLDPWRSYNPLKPFNDLTTINHSMALWMSLTDASSLTVAGVVPKTTNIVLKKGWNFVGYPSFAEKTVADALSGVIYDRVEGYDNTPPQYLKLYGDSDIMKPGFGFWIKVPFDQSWIVAND